MTILRSRPTRLAAALALLVPLGAGAAPGDGRPHVQRCGWIQNPSPANWYLVDRDGEWLMGQQGGHQAKGLDEVQDLTARHWTVTNGSSYGYGCGCVTGAFDTRSKRATAIARVRQKPLAACRADRKLPRP